MDVQSIKVLGSGCKNCHKLLENTQAAAKALGIAAEVEFVTDMQEIAESGAMRMPVLLVNGRIAAQGRVLKAQEIAALLR